MTKLIISLVMLLAGIIMAIIGYSSSDLKWLGFVGIAVGFIGFCLLAPDKPASYIGDDDDHLTPPNQSTD